MSATLFANIAVTFALCLVQEETVQTGFCHKSVQTASVVVEEQEVVGGTEADEWQETTVGEETASDIESWEICDI